ncbi:MAG: aldo/keto reductase [Leptolyngbya sp. SIO1E4]|nr:aldo/keto reductase [Leptolyngbya sp. SIO1E4]
MKTFTLNDGNVIPAFGLGTWKSHEGDAYQAVKEALRIGYHHIDGAWIYGNEAEVGRGICESIAAGVIAREDVFVTSKLWNSFHAPEAVEAGCRETLTAFGLDYLDLYLMHWPVAFRPGTVMPQDPEGFWPLPEMPLAKTFEAMVKLRDQGLVKSVGVSNFSISKLERLIAACGVTPAVNQVELHPYHPQTELLAYCRKQGIHLTAYSPLGSRDRPDSMKAVDEPPLLDNETVKSIAAEEGLTPGQLLIAWAIDRGTSVIPKSTHPDRIAQNLAAASHTLSAKARSAIDAIDIHFRYVNPQSWFIPGVTYEGSGFWV